MITATGAAVEAHAPPYDGRPPSPPFAMATHRYLHLDVFTAGHGGGNHLGVVADARGWSDKQMQALARWTDLVETTFLLPPDDPQASYKVRIFTPTREIPFAGHPSIGSAHAVLTCALAEPVNSLLLQECAVGTLPIRVEAADGENLLLLKSPPARVLTTGVDADPQLAPALAGVALDNLPPALVDGGRRWWVAQCASEAALRAWRPDHDAIRALGQRTDSMGVCAFARADASANYQLVVRALAGGAGIDEDPASGAANGLVAAYLAHAEPDGPLARGYDVSQGREIGHDARLVVRIDGVDIWVGGHTRTIVDGTLDWPTI